ncbi:MAG: homoserine dehydrogenase [Halieaceae bacterium]|nr:homoserine dehydrogenase [Halieaceae bacterium]
MSGVRLGLCGLGTVGSSLVNVLQRNAAVIAARAGCEVSLTHVASRRTNPACDLGGLPVNHDILAVPRDPNVNLVIELVGGTDIALELVREALANGKHVVTANKALIAEYGNELFAEAEAAGVSIAYEAAVGGGIPIIKTLREGLSGNRIQRLAGIINGTTNFVLSAMWEQRREFAEVLREAQQLGYAEADPSFDIEGVDAAHKLSIMAAIAFGMPLQIDGVYTEGICTIAPQDLAYASELGYRVKHLAVAQRSNGAVEMRVTPALIPQDCLLASVNGVKNAVLVEADAVGTSLYYGDGAGGEPTASAVLADVVDLARALGRAQRPVSGGLGYTFINRNLPMLPVEDMQAAYYLRMSAADQPGVMSAIASIFSAAGISIEALLQKPPEVGQTQVPVTILTDTVREADLRAAVTSLEALPSIAGSITRIRVESLDG